ncbi:dual specificity protein phosphatase 3 [Aplysia californica]|uniref:Dual specificity protein phosphatase n=1 Tax=Aplysia californica TaxID=6500 RepID=A0ABM0K6Q8_APLCA|nr:dual specificity protein phosphatase 3 [Aplysia californica]
MTQTPVNLKLFFEVKEFLQSSNDDASSKKVKAVPPGSFSLFQFPMEPKNPCDEVYPGIFIGNGRMAKEPEKLQQIGVTHVVNVSMGPKFNQVNTDSVYYDWYNIQFHGIPAMDVISFKLTPYLSPAAEFIEDALSNKGVVYVHCQQGVSRSASVVLAFLMLKRNLGLMEAVQTVRAKREIFPNEGFLKELVRLNDEIFCPDQVAT